MNLRLGSLAAHLVDKPPDQPLERLVNRINERINPPEPVTADNIHVRSMYLVSDEVNSFGGCFPTDEHERLLPLLVDVPVLIGHRKDRLPIARTFDAFIEQRDGHQWVKVLFYWLDDGDSASALAVNIDGGLYKECSIGFVYRFPECSICGADMRNCDHQPLQQYDRDGATVTAHYNYRQVERVLECSLVYRGAQPNTAITRSLHDWYTPEEYQPADDDDAMLFVTPAYDGIPVTLSFDGKTPTLTSCDGIALPDDITERFGLSVTQSAEPLFGQLVGYRGKQRCSVGQTRSFLNDGAGPVSRVELKLALSDTEVLTNDSSDSTHCISRLNHRITTGDDLPDVSSQLATRDGVRVGPLTARPPYHPGYRYDPSSAVKQRGSWELHEDNSAVSLVLHQGTIEKQLPLLRKPNGLRNASGNIARLIKKGDGMIVHLDDGTEHIFQLRPVILHGRTRYLCREMGESHASH